MLGLVLCTMVGAGLGTLNVLSNYGYSPHSGYVSKVVGNDWAWLTVGYLTSRSGASYRQSFQRAALALLAAVAVYYSFDWPLAARASPTAEASPAGYLLEVILWCGIVLVTSAALSGLASLARRGRWVGVLAGAVVPAFIAYTAYRSHWYQEAIPQGSNPELHAVTGYIWPIAAIWAITSVTIGIARLLRPRRAPAP